MSELERRESLARWLASALDGDGRNAPDSGLAALGKHETVLAQRWAVDPETRESERIRLLDEQVLQANQRRIDVTKRVDDLIAQIDQLDSQLGTIES